MTEVQVDQALLRKIPIFNSLSDEELQHIIQSPDNKIEEYEPKQLIIRESEIGDSMYIVLSGAVEVSIRGAGGAIGREITVATLRTGDFFGEQSLNTDTTGRRNASVRAFHPTKLFKIDKKHVRLGLRGEQLSESEDITAPITQVIKAKNSEVRKLISGMRLFQSLSDTELNTIDHWAKVETVGPGDFVLKESEKGDCMYVVLDGTVEIFTFDEEGKIVILATLEKGDHFGEQALMPGSNDERNAYARTNNISKLIQVPKSYFRLVLNRDSAIAKALKKIGNAQKQEINKIQKS